MTSVRVVSAALLVALLGAVGIADDRVGPPPPVSGHDAPRLAAYVDHAFVVGSFLYVAGWSAGEGVAPQSQVFIDGVATGRGWSAERPDVCAWLIQSAGWYACGDDIPTLCVGLSGDVGIAPGCVGVIAWLPVGHLSPGTHVVQICAAHLDSLDMPALQACSQPMQIQT